MARTRATSRGRGPTAAARDARTSWTDSALTLAPPMFRRPISSWSSWLPATVEDRRLWTPTEAVFRPYKRLSGAPGRVVPSRPPSGPQGPFKPRRGAFLSLPVRLSWESPRSMLVCHRRSTRREVLHALGQAGRRGMRRPRWNESSSITCGR